MLVDTATTRTVAEALRSDVVAYAAAIFLLLWLNAERGRSKALRQLVEVEKAHGDKMLELVEQERERTSGETERNAKHANDWLQLDYTMRAFLGCVKAGVWVLKKPGDRLKPANLPEDPQDRADLVAAFEAKTASTKLPEGSGE